jgi:DNA-binding NarL/FixJ family response regulator
MRVLLATDRSDFGYAVSFYLSQREIHVVEVVGGADQLVDRVMAVRPDAVLVDWSLGAADASRAVAELNCCGGPAPVIVLSTSQDRGRAMSCGADAYATLGDPPDSLLAALEQVTAGPQ